MFASALKSISSTNIQSNYTISANVTSTAGPWKIYDAKKKSTGKACSVFVFDRKSLDAHSSGLSRSSAAAFKKVADEVVERLRKEASALAKLRHPSVLELVEPVEEIRGGGLQFATEAVTASLASLLQEKDDQERRGGSGRASRYVAEDADGNRRRRELEIDELEIQKGLLQISKALEFLHENAGLVHGNLTPDAILVNAKGDWKISGLSFCSPPEGSTKPTSFQPISLSEVLHPDSRLPRTVQLNLDYTSPDFVLDNNLTTSADMFSLGLLCIALYNSPHRSPIECNSSITTYKRVFQSPSTIPSAQNVYLSSRPPPKDLSSHVLPRLITRRPANRMTAREFQQSEYFDNILVSTIRFLDAFPAKTPNEKAQFLRGLIKVLPSFPKSVMEKKVLPALLEEMKDRELISLILHNVFKIIELLPSGRRAFGDKIRPSLKEIFVTNAKQKEEKDAARDAGLMIILEQLPVITDNCSGKEFKDDILPIIFAALESPTPTLVDAALRSLPTILPVLDFSTIKNELFPVVAIIFSKTNSLAIKVRGLQAFVILCGGSNDPGSDDGLDGLMPDKKKTSSSTALDKYTMQEKIVPLIKAIKTKEPAVMMAALSVLRVVGQVADADFVAMDILPVLWSMSLGPLLNLTQFRSFMDLIKILGGRVEDEQVKKLQELNGGSTAVVTGISDDFMTFGTIAGSSLDANGTTEDDFTRLVKGKTGENSSSNPLDSSGWENMGATSTSAVTSPTGVKPGGGGSGRSTPTPAFSWSTPSPATTTTTAPATNHNHQFGAAVKAQAGFRTVTPDLLASRFEALTPASTQFSQPLQPTTTTTQPSISGTSVNWGGAATTTTTTTTTTATTTPAVSSNPWASSSTVPPTSSFGSMSLGQQQRPALNQTTSSSSFSLPPPPSINTTSSTPVSGFSLAPPPGAPKPQQQSTNFGGLSGMGIGMGTGSSTMGGMNRAGSMNSLNTLNSMGSSMNKSMNSMNMGGGSGMGMGMGMMQPLQPQPQQPQQQPQQSQSSSSSGGKSGLDKYESLL
ncbi:kinase-like domain-containing protein [Diplogelasinospora grovesii]|uniref:Kinase-like domain-containing protein n=1 Tax=Diplogelasinospora grovesii TaxID=303347 RepID=A0AAN6S922_9PEZI|nr:kinase-like domain-containing protein [Diplogelasinospora grovesii]